MFRYNDNRPFIGCQIHHFWLHSCYNHYFVYISSLVCQYYDEHFIFTNWKLKCIDRWMKNKELETRFIFQQKDIKFFVHTLMQKYVTPRSRNVRKQNSRLCSCWVHMLRRSSIYSNRNWSEVSYTEFYSWQLLFDLEKPVIYIVLLNTKCNYFHSNCHL